jgi:hypothetical protein
MKKNKIFLVLAPASVSIAVFAQNSDLPMTEDIHIKSLGLKTETGAKISSIKMLGSEEKITWTQDDNEAVIKKPSRLPDYNTVAFAVKLK